jgi:hypothetical protein
MLFCYTQENFFSMGLTGDLITKLKRELDELDTESVEIDGIKLKPSQCYHFGTSPAHVLFNTNCPESLKIRVQAIIDKYSAGVDSDYNNDRADQ